MKLVNVDVKRPLASETIFPCDTPVLRRRIYIDIDS